MLVIEIYHSTQPKHPQFPRWENSRLQSWQVSNVTFYRMWPHKYVWLNFAILKCSLNVWIVNKMAYLQRQNCVKSALPNPKFFLHCLKWRYINHFWRKFQTSISSTLPNIFGWKVTNVISGTYRTFCHIFRVYSTTFQRWVCWLPFNEAERQVKNSEPIRSWKIQVGEITWPCHVTGVPTPPFSSNQALNSYAIFKGVGKSH